MQNCTHTQNKSTKQRSRKKQKARDHCILKLNIVHFGMPTSYRQLAFQIVTHFSLCQDKAEHTANCLAFGMDGLTIVYVQLSLVSWLFLSNFLCISIAQSVAVLCLFGQFPSLSHHKTEKKKEMSGPKMIVSQLLS